MERGDLWTRTICELQIKPLQKFLTKTVFRFLRRSDAAMVCLSPFPETLFILSVGFDFISKMSLDEPGITIVTGSEATQVAYKIKKEFNLRIPTRWETELITNTFGIAVARYFLQKKFVKNLKFQINLQSKRLQIAL